MLDSSKIGLVIKFLLFAGKQEGSHLESLFRGPKPSFILTLNGIHLCFSVKCSVLKCPLDELKF